MARILRDVEFQTRADRDRVSPDGSTFKDFAEELRSDLGKMGITAEDSGHLRMVFRTNVQSAYSLGRDRASKVPSYSRSALTPAT